MRITFQDTEGHGPAGKLADAEIHFDDGPLAGLRLIGFAVWTRRDGAGCNITFPARTYMVNGDRRTFALLRPQADQAASDTLRDAIVAAYHDHQARQGIQPGAVPLSALTPTQEPRQEPARCTPASSAGFAF